MVSTSLASLLVFQNFLNIRTRNVGSSSEYMKMGITEESSAKRLRVEVRRQC